MEIEDIVNAQKRQITKLEDDVAQALRLSHALLLTLREQPGLDTEQLDETINHYLQVQHPAAPGQLARASARVEARESRQAR